MGGRALDLAREDLILQQLSNLLGVPAI
jgi:hypothetical protein